MSAAVVTCVKCGAEFDPDARPRHAHCSDCGALLGQRGVAIRHRIGCPRLRLQKGQVCLTCGRLLAAGTSCPEHGASP